MRNVFAFALLSLAAACGDDGPPAEYCCPCLPGEQVPGCEGICSSPGACPEEDP